MERVEEHLNRLLSEERHVELAGTDSFIVLEEGGADVVLEYFLEERLVDVIDDVLVNIFIVNDIAQRVSGVSSDQNCSDSFQEPVDEANFGRVFIVSEGEAEFHVLPVLDVMHDKRIAI